MRPRREPGSGSIYPLGDYWCAAVIADGKKVRRRRRTEAEALDLLAAMLVEFAGRLGYYYSFPRPFVPGKGPHRERAGVKKGVRFEVFTRDGFRCRYCGAPGSRVELVADHAISVADGGTDDVDNLVTACVDCNVGKGSRSVVPPPLVPA